jgi:hypothetical protein
MFISGPHATWKNARKSSPIITTAYYVYTRVCVCVGAKIVSLAYITYCTYFGIHACTHTHIHTLWQGCVSEGMQPTALSSAQHMQHSLNDACTRKALHVQQQDWEKSISVNIFKAGCSQDVKVITLAELDADMFACHSHPMQLEKETLLVLRDRHGVKKHVRDMVPDKLLMCVPEGPNPVKIGNRKGIKSAAQQLPENRYAAPNSIV